MKGHIRKRGEKSWAIVLDKGRDAAGRRRQQWVTVQGSKRKAETKLAELIHQIDTGTFVEPTKSTVREFMRRWLDSSQSTVGAKTHERYGQLVNHHIVPHLGALPLVRLQPIKIQEFYDDLLTKGRKDGNGGLSPQSVLHVHRVLRLALKQAVKWQIIARNPADAVTPPKVQRKEMTTLNEDGTASLFTMAEGTRMYVPIIVAATLGLRRGEILGLAWSDLDLETGLARIQRSLQQTRAGIKFKTPKNGKGRVVRLPRLTVDVLVSHRKEQAEIREALGLASRDQDLVCSMADGSPWRPDDFSSAFRRFRKKWGLNFSFHNLRHTHATLLLRQGVHPKIVSERLGHSSVQITLDVYSHALPELQEQATDNFDIALGAAIQRRNRALM